jgi:cytochrome c oxidase subunit I
MTELAAPPETGVAIPEVVVDDGGVSVERIRSLTIRYIVASTAILLVGGALGGALRQSQANLEVLDPATWYAVMTAHGLAAFVGWAAFALMGVTWWVLAECGLPLTRWGWRWAVACWWTMIVGVAGIVVSTLSMSFGGSWVFLYPIAEHSAGAWDDLAAGLFSLSVLVVGLSIFAYCFGILATVTGPGLRAGKPGWANRVGVALGLGILWPRRFPSERPVPYPVIPATVIAIDMIIATIPLAVLLLVMTAQAFGSSTGVDPLLAKGMLWFFGHPVVYLLLFPAVMIYYHLIPRYARRPLVAGHVIAVGWLIGVVSNVIIGAHHMYMDFPDDLAQAVNGFSQPLTYAVTIPSALSLFSIGFTIYRSHFHWTPASRFLAVALVSWLVAGLQGVGLATIHFDAVAHNTLWVVGHFHNMALLNIGLVIFGCVYAIVPQLVGREWYSERLADWHLALTVVGGYGSVIPWMWQGADGAPRRWAVLPDEYLDGTRIALPFIALIVAGQALFVWNLARTLGWRWVEAAVGEPPESRPDRTTPREGGREALGSVLVALAFATALSSLWSDPFLWAPMAIVLAYVGFALGARRQAAWTMVVAGLLAVVGVVMAAL